MPLSSSHVSSSKINTTFSNQRQTTPTKSKITPPAGPSMSFAQMQSQSINGGTRTGAAPVTLPAQGSITAESITAMSTGSYKPGTLGAYQSKAVNLMQSMNRSSDFMIKNLNQATAMQMPNWNLPAGQASQAASMAGAGRSQSFVREQLGVSSSTPVPGTMAR